MKKRMMALGVAAVVAVAGIQAQAAMNLLVNGGFDTGDTTGWTVGGNTGFSGVEGSGWNGYTAQSGNFFFALGAIGSDTLLSQTIATVPTASYTVSWYYNSQGYGPQDFSVQWQGNTLWIEASSGPWPGTFGNWAHFSYTVTAPAATATILFAGYNTPAWDALDSISVTGPSPVPEPTTCIAGIAALGLALALRRRA